MCMIDYGDPPSVYRVAERRAAKMYSCAECQRLIERGETYRNAFMVYEGSPSTFRTCAHCSVGQRWLEQNCGGFLHEGVWGDIEEHGIEYPKLALPLMRLSVGYRRKWRRFDGAGLMAVPAVPPTLEQAGL